MKKITFLACLQTLICCAIMMYFGGMAYAQITLVKDLRPGQFGALENNPEFVVFNSELYFFADDGVHGKELWKTDGTDEGTVLVKDIVPGSGSSFPSSLKLSGSTLYFLADDGLFGRELWKTDGTEAGTSMIKNIHPNSTVHQIGELFDYNGTLIFRADDGFTGLELWKSSGTENSTILIKDIFEGGIPSNPSNFSIHANFLYFTATGTDGTELYRTTGSESSTELVKDLFTGGNAISPNSSSPGPVISLGNNPYFSAFVPIPNTNQFGRRLCVVEANFLFNIVAGDPNPELLIKSGNLIYYRSISPTLGVGTELFASTGVGNENTFNLVKDIRLGGASSSPSGLTDYNGTLLFRANDGIHGVELWRSDGSESGTVMVKDIFAGSSSSGFTNSRLGTVIQDLLFFNANDGVHGNELWVSDGTENGTYLVMDLNNGTNWSEPGNFIEYNGFVYFSANDGVVGRELFRVELQSLSTEIFEPNKITHFFDSSSKTLTLQDVPVAATLQLFAMSGKKVYEQKLTEGTHQAELSHVSNGIYIVKIHNKKQTQTFKIAVY